MARHRQEQVQVMDKYSTHMFYGSSAQEAPTQRFPNSFGATYSNGQARPVFAPAQTNSAPAARVQVQPKPITTTPLYNDTARHDQIVLSNELHEERNSSSWNDTAAVRRQQPRQDGANGPAYSSDMLAALDSLLNGRGAAV